MSLDVPAAILAIMVILAMYVIYKAQQRDDFDFGDMLKDDNNRPSALRFGIFTSLGVSSWVVIYDTINFSGADPYVLVIYVSFWSGAPIAAKFVEALQAKWVK